MRSIGLASGTGTDVDVVTLLVSVGTGTVPFLSVVPVIDRIGEVGTCAPGLLFPKTYIFGVRRRGTILTLYVYIIGAIA